MLHGFLANKIECPRKVFDKWYLKNWYYRNEEIEYKGVKEFRKQEKNKDRI